MATVLTNYETWKDFLKERVQAAQSAGMNEQTITQLAVEVGNFLDQRVDPKNEQQRALKELWDVADQSERNTIAHLMVKLVQQS
jgi:hypothetical protein